MKKLLIFTILAFLASSVQAANLLYSENFDDQDLDAPSVGSAYLRSGGSTTLSAGQYTYATGHGGTGYAMGSGTVEDVFVQWDYGANWPTNEMYVSFWMQYPSITLRADNMNLKFFYPHWVHGAGNNYVCYAVYSSASSLYYNAFHSGAGVTPHKYYYTAPNMTTGGWHHYEFYVNFPSGISRMWYDGVLIVEETYDQDWGNTPVMTYLTFGAQDSEEDDTFTRFIDDIEVWDGMPDSEGTAPTANFSQDKTTCNAPCTVTFTDTSTDSPTSWDWDWGDGTAHGTTQNPTHQYTAEGTYTPTLRASNAYGGTSHTGDTISITVVPAPVADFMYAVDPDDEDYVAPVTALFSDTSTNSPTSWAWDFDNDGDTDMM